MPIVGLTDKRQDDRSILGRIEVSVFKGDRKPTSGYGFGKDLGPKLRITTANAIASTILKQSKAYGLPNGLGDFFAESINIYLPFDEVDRTFPTRMASYTSSNSLKMICDRDTISKKCVETRDEKGNIFRPIVPANEPCPMRGKGLSEECPNGCTKEGKFFFYIQELFDKDLMMPCVLTTHSYEDLTYLTAILSEMCTMIGGLTNSPFPAYQYRHKIPFILSRNEVKIRRPIVEKKLRTGGKSASTTWALTLQVNPEWMELHRKWQQVKEMEDRKMLVSQATVVGLLSGDSSTVIDVEVVSEQRSLPPVAIPPAQNAPAQNAIASDITPERILRMRDRCIELAEKYQEVTGEIEMMPDLRRLSEAELIEYGKGLKSRLDNALESIPLQIEEEGVSHDR